MNTCSQSHGTAYPTSPSLSQAYSVKMAKKEGGEIQSASQTAVLNNKAFSKSLNSHNLIETPQIIYSR